MNILINIPNLKKEDGGIYQYSVALLKILAKGSLVHDFYVLWNDPNQDVIDLVENYPNFSFTKTRQPHYSKTQRLLIKFLNLFFSLLGQKSQFKKRDLYDSIIKDYNIHIIHTPMQSLVKKEKIKSITTLHDVQELYFPQFFSSEQRAHRAVRHKRAVDGADAVIVSYNHVKSDIQKYFAKPEAQIHTVLLDMQDLWFDKIKTRNLSLLDAYGLSEHFLLYPASSWEHKNHLRLIEALISLDNPEMQLICTGHPTEHYRNTIKPYIEEQGLDAKVRFLGVVSDEVLYELYHSCRAVVVPTLYEAGSFPLMESVLMGIPVVCSNVTSLPEVMGDNRFVFSPFDIKDMANKMNKIWSDTEYRKENIALLKVQAEKLKDNNASSKINKIYEELMVKEL